MAGILGHTVIVVVTVIICFLLFNRYCCRTTPTDVANIDTAQSVLIEATCEELDCEQKQRIVERANELSENRYDLGSCQFSFDD